jgi:hypothetical protein
LHPVFEAVGGDGRREEPPIVRSRLKGEHPSRPESVDQRDGGGAHVGTHLEDIVSSHDETRQQLVQALDDQFEHVGVVGSVTKRLAPHLLVPGVDDESALRPVDDQGRRVALCKPKEHVAAKAKAKQPALHGVGRDVPAELAQGGMKRGGQQLFDHSR